MPKIKTNRSAAKRFRMTGSGKIVRRRQGLRHILTKKSRSRKNRLGKLACVDASNVDAVLRMVPKATLKK